MRYFHLLWNLLKCKQNEKKTREQMKALQEKKLREMLLFAYKNSPYYHRAFEDAGIHEDAIQKTPLKNFPMMDKKILMEHFDELITVNDAKQEDLRRFDAQASLEEKAFRGMYHVVHSSGSTGKPGYFLYDQDAWDAMITGMIRAALWGMSMGQIIKFLLKGPRILYVAATDGRYGGAMAVGDGIDGVGAKQLFLDIKTPLSEWITKIREFRPNMIVGYPSAIKIVGELERQGKIQLEVSRIVSCGEPLGASLRQYLEQTFHTIVLNYYGASESLALGVQMTGENGLSLFDDMNVIEVEEDSLYLTSLYNFAQPLIRYRISDRLQLLPDEENWDGPFTKVKAIEGRSEDLLWFEDGRGEREFLHPLAIEGFCVEGLLDYQFRQLGKDAFEMLAQVTDEGKWEWVGQEMLRQMKEILEEKNLGYVQFYVRFVDEILPDTHTGKKKLIAA